MMMQRTVTAVVLLALGLVTAPAAVAQTSEVNRPWCGDVDGSRECVYATLRSARWMRPEGHRAYPTRAAESSTAQDERGEALDVRTPAAKDDHFTEATMFILSATTLGAPDSRGWRPRAI